MEQTIHIKGPDFVCELSPFEQISPPVYSKRILCFSKPFHDIDLSVKVLKLALQSLIDQVPTLAGELIKRPPEKCKQADEAELRPGGSAILKVKDLTQEFDYDRFRQENFPVTWLDADVLVPVGPGVFLPTNTPMPMSLVGANFVKNGLLLVFCFHHAVLDGRGITKAINLFAEHCREGQQALTADVPYSPRPLDPALLDRSPLFSAPDKSIVTDFGLVDAPAAGSLDDYSKVTDFTTNPIVSQTFNLSHRALQELKAEASKQMDTSNEAATYISTQDALFALISRSVFKARLATGFVSKDQRISLWIPVDFRQRHDPLLPHDALYNAILPTPYTIALKDVLAPDGLGKTAQAYRAGINRVNGERVRDLNALLLSQSNIFAKQWSLIQNFFSSEFLITTYKDFEIYSFQWPTAIGKFERFRLPNNGLANSMPVIYPMRPNGSLEVAIALNLELMNIVKDDDDWKRFTEPVDAAHLLEEP